MKLAHRLRSIGVSALLWGGAWAAAYTAVDILHIIATAPSGMVPTRLTDIFPQMAIAGAAWGMVAGATFGVVFRWTQRGQRIAQLSRSRAAAWGALAGAVVPALDILNATLRASGPVPVRWWSAGLVSCLGAISAAAAVHLATRPSRPSPDTEDLNASLHPELPEGVAPISGFSPSAARQQSELRPP